MSLLTTPATYGKTSWGKRVKSGEPSKPLLTEDAYNADDGSLEG